MLLTISGVLLVILSFFAALGVAIISGLKMNITTGWTLPFILIGLGTHTPNDYFTKLSPVSSDLIP